MIFSIAGNWDQAGGQRVLFLFCINVMIMLCCSVCGKKIFSSCEGCTYCQINNSRKHTVSLVLFRHFLLKYSYREIVIVEQVTIKLFLFVNPQTVCRTRKLWTNQKRVFNLFHRMSCSTWYNDVISALIATYYKDGSTSSPFHENHIKFDISLISL